jgi:amino-acid N-acetyltransferase
MGETARGNAFAEPLGGVAMGAGAPAWSTSLKHERRVSGRPPEGGLRVEVSLRRALPADKPAVEALLLSRELPLDGLDSNFETFWVADAAGTVVGTAGLEVHGRLGLLRSLAVHPDSGGAGIGSRLTWQLLEEAVGQGLREVFLLTTTAEDFFPRFGFVRLRRREVPAEVQESAEFTACAATAVAMRWSPTASGLYEPPTVI